MERRDLLSLLAAKISEREEYEREADRMTAQALDVDVQINDVIDQLQPRIEVTSASPFVPQSLPETPQTPSERVLDALENSRLNPVEIADATGLRLNQIGPCLGRLVRNGLVRNVGNGTWTAA